MFKLREEVELKDGKFEYEKYPDYARYAAGVVANAVTNLTALFRDNYYAKDIIAGWRYGYAPAAVARYILERAVETSAVQYAQNMYQARAITVLRQLLRVNEKGWGALYDYTPSVAELSTPAAIVQADINKRLAANRTLAVAHAEEVNGIIPRYRFNETIDNPGIIKHDSEVAVVLAFTSEVFVETRKLIHQVFDEIVDV